MLQTSRPYQEMMVDSDTLLFHYTDSYGLLGILQSNSIWVTDTAFLSDPVEMHYSATLISEVIQRYISDNPHRLSNEQLDQLRMQPTHTIYNPAFRERVGANRPPSGFIEAYAVFSLSTSDDSLLLWREYADRGNGYALAIRACNIEGHLQSGNWPVGSFLRRVIYQPEQQTELITQVIATHLDYYRENEINFETTMSVLNHALQRQLPVLKPQYYEPESEVRFIFVVDLMLGFSLPMVEASNESSRVNSQEFSVNLPTVEPAEAVFSDKDGIIVPRIRLRPAHGSCLAIEEVVIGPSLNQEVAEFGVRRLCDRYYYPGTIQTRRSKVAYRSHL